ncbi:MAG: hypothetical protein QF752_03630 [Planctomycetota bacterium]|jgi:RNA polymerase sigma-70 factor (ECF subfamily)|nr:hypothetical protein [Planctomycetota bacterium]
MSSPSSNPVPAGKDSGAQRPFPTTLWTLIGLCNDEANPEFRSSLEELCNRYWPPVYFYIRRNWEPNRDRAKDLCQAYFLQFLDKNFLESVDAEKGKFRSFVCASLRNFLLKEKQAAGRLKRRPAQGAILSMNALGADEDTFDIPDVRQSPEEADAQFLADWNRCVVRNALARMREAARESDKTSQVEVFAHYRIEHEGDTPPTRKQLAELFGLTHPQVNYALKWGQQEFVQALKAELRDQVSSEADFHAEARELFGI